METPVSIGCDWPGCGEVVFTLALAADSDNITDVRRRAVAAAVANANATGWRAQEHSTAALCPRHAHPAPVVLL